MGESGRLGLGRAGLGWPVGVGSRLQGRIGQGRIGLSGRAEVAGDGAGGAVGTGAGSLGVDAVSRSGSECDGTGGQG